MAECAFFTWSEEEKEEKRQKLIEIAAQGGHQDAMSIALGLKSTDTFYRWKREIPEFKEWCEEAKMYSKAAYEQEAWNMIQGKTKGNATTLALVMNNKFGDEYKRSPTGSDNTKIENNTTINVLHLSKEEVRERTIQQIEELKSFGIVYDQPDSV